MSQTYPIGRDNLNQLIQLQLGTEAFDIIHKVADNMETLKKAITLLDQMSELQGIVDMEARLTVLHNRLDTLENTVQTISINIEDLTAKVTALENKP